MIMYLKLDGEIANRVYQAFGRQPSPEDGSVEYEEFDDHLTVKANVVGSKSITMTQHYGGAVEAFLSRRDSGILVRSFMDDVDVKAVLTAIREAIGPQSPTPPVYRPGDYGLR